MTMEKFDNAKELVDRVDLISKIEDSVMRRKGLYDPAVINLISKYLHQEMNDSELSDTTEISYYGQVKKAALYFDAGFPGEAMKILRDVKLEAKATGHTSFIEKISSKLQAAINEM